MVKVALVYPECYDVARYGKKRAEFPPFGVLYLASSLEACGCEVSIFSADNDKYSFDFFQFDLVGYSLSSSFSYPLMRNSLLTSQYNDSSFVMVGGIHASLYPYDMFQELSIDIVSVGEGEKAICEIVTHLDDRDFSEIKGIYYKENGEIIYTGEAEIITCLDDIPFPARHLLPDDKILMKRLANTEFSIAHLLFTRGCPYHCNFCANQNHHIRYRSSDNIVKELKMLQDTYGIQGFCVTDDNFLTNREKALSILEGLTPLNLKWSTLSRVDSIDLELLKRLKESGCIEIKYGIESGSQRMLDSMNKKIMVEQIKETLFSTYQVGISSKTLIMHGYPGENIQTTLETIALLDEVKEYISRVGLTYFTYLPGSPIYESKREECSYSVYLENQVVFGDDRKKEEVLEARKILKKYIEDTFHPL